MSTRRITFALALVYGAAWCLPVAAADTRVDRLIRQLGSEDFDERQQASKDLIEMGVPALPALRRAAMSADPEVATRAKACIPVIEVNEKVMALVPHLKSKSAKDRADTISLLGPFGAGAYKAVPALIVALDDDDADVRLRAVNMLGGIGPAAGPAVERLIRMLQDKSHGEDMRWLIMKNLADIGRPARKAAPVLLQILEAESGPMQRGAATFLGDLGQHNEKVVPALIKALEHKEVYVCLGAAFSLGQLGEQPELAVPALVRFWKKRRGDTDFDGAREIPLRALRGFGANAKAALPVLMATIKDDHEPEEMRKEALLTLASIGTAAREAIPTLKALLEREGKYGRLTESLEKALESIKP
jgi:HEAT repeat protein